MREIILAKYGELALKGQNRPVFESALLKTIRRRVATVGKFRVYKAQSTVYVEPQDDEADVNQAFELMSRVFGISALSKAGEVQKDIVEIERAAVERLGGELAAAKTFRVSAKRSDKSFPLNSPQIGCELGGYILERFPHLTVAMTDPDVNVVVEVRDYAAYVHGGSVTGAGGMPTGTSGRAAVMLSGGIDSPVAAFMAARRGLDLVAVHFMSPPYTSERALDKVDRLASVLSRWCGNLALICVPFTETQVALRESCPEELFTVLMRRSMLRITNIICAAESCGAIITGESLAQVASQTLSAIACTDEAAAVPVLRPLIGNDKNEIVEAARRIDTFDISIEPYEDCCTVFTPRHPKTKPRIDDIFAAETLLDLNSLETRAASQRTVVMKHFSD
ncbi:MAG: tRNA uracil 4-sulfurtransferase ThiI [Oscillospiraceae bacterium]